MEVAVSVFRGDDVVAFGDFVVAIAFFEAQRDAAKRDFVGVNWCAVVEEGHGASGFDDENVIGGAGIGGLGCAGTGGEGESESERGERAHGN